MKNVVLALRDVSVYVGDDIVSVGLGPEIVLRRLFFKQLAGSLGVGLTGQLHIRHHLPLEIDGKSDEKSVDWGLFPYLKAMGHYFPARCWSLDFGLRAGIPAHTRRFWNDKAQASKAVSIEYVGGVTWYH